MVGGALYMSDALSRHKFRPAHGAIGTLGLLAAIAALVVVVWDGPLFQGLPGRWFFTLCLAAWTALLVYSRVHVAARPNRPAPTADV